MSVSRRTFLSLLGSLSALPGVSALAVRPPVPLRPVAVAGARYHGLATVAHELGIGTVLALRREPDNPHDANAIEILGPGGVRLGYVPRAAAREYAPMMDEGADIEARISGFVPRDWKIPEDVVRTDLVRGAPILSLTRI